MFLFRHIQVIKLVSVNIINQDPTGVTADLQITLKIIVTLAIGCEDNGLSIAQSFVNCYQMIRKFGFLW